MQVGQRFTLDGITYYIDQIGPVMTSLKREDGFTVPTDTDDLRRFLKVIENEHDRNID